MAIESTPTPENPPTNVPGTPETPAPAAPSNGDTAAAPTAQPAGDFPSPAITSVAAGPAPQVLYTPETATTAHAPAATPNLQDELLGSWLAAHLHKADIPYLALVVVLAFLLGSFTVRNPEVWTYLATGRLLSEGNYQFGVDPFSYTTEAKLAQPAVTWVNHSWLFSWLCYLLYEESGFVLVVAKALCVAALAVVLLLVRPPGRHGWAGTMCILLAVVVASKYVLLQPIVVSYLFLGLTLLILQPRSGVLAPVDERTKPKLLWLLPPLFALWINLDAWFVLGPLLVGVCLLALYAESLLSGIKPRVCLRQLSIVLGVGILACLVNPHFHKALFMLPPELGYLLVSIGNFWPESLVAGGTTYYDFTRFGALQGNQPFTQTMATYTPEFLTSSAQGQNVAGIGFIVLLSLVIGSFFVCNPAVNGSLAVRAVPVLFFGVLAVLIARLIPLFAIVGGVVLVLNVQEFLSRRETKDPTRMPEHDLWANLSRLLTGFLLFGLFFLAWPGWVNWTIGDYSSPRRVAWSVEEDPSLKRAAEFLENMHKEGELNRGFNLSADIASYCAWRAPGLRFFVDQRYSLFDKSSATFNRIREEFRPDAQRAVGPQSWPDTFDDYQIDHIVGGGRDAKLIAMSLLAYPRKDIETIYADGHLYIIAWKKGFRKKGLELTQQWQRQAFGKPEHPVELSKGMPPLETDPGFWHSWAFGQKRSSLTSLESQLLLEYYRGQAADPTWRRYYFPGWILGSFTSDLALAIGPAPHVARCGQYFQLVLPTMQLQSSADNEAPRRLFELGWRIDAYFGSQAATDVGAPDVLLLSLRAARQAVALDPEDPLSYRMLAESYRQIQVNTEAHWTRLALRPQQPNLRMRIRNCQFVAALQHYLLLKPGDVLAQWELGNFFLNQGFYDLALDHCEKALKLQEEAPLNPTFGDKGKKENLVQDIRRKVDMNSRYFDLKTANMSDLDKLWLIVTQEPFDFEVPGGGKQRDTKGFGLWLKARELARGILNDKLATYSANEEEKFREAFMRLALETGVLWEVEMLRKAPDPKDRLFVPRQLNFLQNMILLNAAEGDYGQADQAIEAFDKLVEPQEKGMADGVGRTAALSFLFSPELSFAAMSSVPVYLFNFAPAGQLTMVQFQKAEHQLLRGLFALESGDTVRAHGFFQNALANPDLHYGDRQIAERYLQLMQPYFSQK